MVYMSQIPYENNHTPPMEPGLERVEIVMPSGKIKA
jgi:hypothetical protein